MRLVACANCHAQYDVTDVIAESFPCRCGETVENRPHEAVDAKIHRCGACGALTTPEAKGCEYCGSAIVRDPRRLSLICPECYARCSEDSRFCTACGVAFRPEKVKVDGHELPCPVCGNLMPARDVGGLGVNECPGCNGLWAPGGTFELLVGRAIEARRNADPAQLMSIKPRVTGSNPAAQQVQYRKCPECDGYMQRRNFRKSSGVIIDTCRSHGTWLDADELEQIAGFILSGGKPAPSLVENPDKAKLDAMTAAAFTRIRMQNSTRSGHRTAEGGVVESLFDLLSGFFK